MYDLVIIGGGWAGFSAAEYAAKSRLKTALVEKGPLGGTCLNQGCIPTKTFLNSAKLLTQFKKSKKLGIDSGSASMDLPGLLKRKEDIISRLRSSLEFVVKVNKIDFFNGDAKIINPNRIEVGQEALEAKYIIIATGSRPKELPMLKFDGRRVISSNDALRLYSVPDKILVIGGGVIGCEFAEIFLALGSQVEIIELTGNLLPGIDSEISRKLESLFKKKGIRLILNGDVSALDLAPYDKILVSVGRAPNFEGLENLNINKDRSGIKVNEYLQTNIPNIYAAGDCIGGYLLAHVASYEGRLAAKNILNGNTEKTDYRAVPCGIFTNPEIATVGLSQEDAGKKYPDLEVKKLDFLKLGMSYILEETEGFIKIVASKDEDILGASIIGPRATELIHPLTLAVNNSLKLRQIRNTIFVHPTISEGILEALLH